MLLEGNLTILLADNTYFQVAALVLAVRSRNVKIKVLNDSKEVALIVYITTIVAVETAILGSVLQDYNNISESLFTGHLLVATSAVVGLVFVPKVSLVMTIMIRDL